jgi:preprotein translocase SecE subunit
MHALITYLRHVRAEFTHVVWPSNRTALAHTLVVVLIAVVMTVLVGVADYVFGTFVSHIVGA